MWLPVAVGALAMGVTMVAGSAGADLLKSLQELDELKEMGVLENGGPTLTAPAAFK